MLINDATRKQTKDVDRPKRSQHTNINNQRIVLVYKKSEEYFQSQSIRKHPQEAIHPKSLVYKKMGCGGSKPTSEASERKVGQPPKVNYGDAGHGPRDAICHICGRKYTVHSINIHIPQCEKLFIAQQEKLPKTQRKSLPMLPKGVSKMDIVERNKVAQKLYEDAVMEKCQYCGRTFMEGRLEKHIKACAKSHGQEYHDPKEQKATYHTGPTDAKNTVICHVCGRKYTAHSIDIHLPQCEKLFLARQEKLPKKERKPLPKEPPKNLTLEQRNDYATKQYNDNVLEACKYCGRTFFPDRLAVHIKSCERNHLKKEQQQQQRQKH